MEEGQQEKIILKIDKSLKGKLCLGKEVIFWFGKVP